LKSFLARRPLARALAHDSADELARLSHLCDEPAEEGTDEQGTPLRAWLITLLRYVERDHVRSRLGWGEGNKRAVGTDAERLPSDGALLGARPPITDALTVAKLAAEVQEAMTELPDGMRRALELWMDERGFVEIAAELALPDAARARALVRAAHA